MIRGVDRMWDDLKQYLDLEHMLLLLEVSKSETFGHLLVVDEGDILPVVLADLSSLACDACQSTIHIAMSRDISP